MGILIIIGKVLITVLIVILSLFLLALLLAGLVLFVPVRYKVVAEKEPAMEGEGRFFGKLSVNGIISWCLFLVRIPFSFGEGGGKHAVRILGIDIIKLSQKFPKKRKVKKKGKFGKRKPEHADVKEACGNGNYGKAEDNKVGSAGENDAEQDNDKPANAGSKVLKTPDEDGKDTDTTALEPEYEERKDGDADILKKIKIFSDKIRKLPSIFSGKCRKAKDSIGLLKSDMVKESICVVWENVVHLWSKLKPRNVSGKLHFGTSDPCLTGWISGAVSVFMGMTGLYLEITPDFEEKVFEGRIEIKGRLQFVTLLKIVVRLYRDENIKKVAKEFNLF